MKTKFIKFESRKDNVKGKILINEKEVEINQRFKSTFIVHKDILNYNEDLVVYILVSHKYKEEDSMYEYLSVAKQIIIPINNYNEYDKDNISYEVEVYIPDYDEYIYDFKNSIIKPKLPFKGYTKLSEEQYYDIRCKVGIMRKSELYASNISKIIKEKNILLAGQKCFLFDFFKAILIFLIMGTFIISIPYLSNILPFNRIFNNIIPFIIFAIILTNINKVLDKLFKVRPKTKPKNR